MRYFRSYSYGVQLLLFLILWYTLYMGTQFFFQPVLFTKITGYPVEQLTKINPASPAALINGAIIVLGISNILVFMLSAFLFAYLTHPHPFEYLGLRAPIIGSQVIWAVLIMLGAMPILLWLGNLMSNINFGPQVKEIQQVNDNIMTAFLNIKSFGGMLKVVFFLALVPAVGEEMFFRGVLMKFIRKRSSNMTFPVILSATLFALMHADVYGMPSIFLAGVLLALIYTLTSSLWCSIAAHIFFNGTQIIINYLSSNDAAVKASMDKNTIPLMLVLGGAVVFCISFYLLQKNKTPLPSAWANDFAPKEPRDDENITTKS